MSGTHSRLSPSGAHRYLPCTASPDASEGIPDTTSEYAAEGTMLHEVADRCLEDGGDPHRFIGDIFEIDGYTFVFDQGHADCMVADLYDIRDQAIGGVIYGETKVDLTDPLGEGEAGTADIILLDYKKELHVQDWKFGEGILVDAEENEQMKLYGRGAINTHFPELLKKPDTLVHLTVRQPRIQGGGSTWTTTVGDLLAWCEDVVKPKVAEINSGNGVFNPGKKQCHWCKARKGAPELGKPPCKAYQKMQRDIARMAFSNYDEAMNLGVEPVLANVEEMSPEERVWLHDNADMFKTFLSELSDRLRTDLEYGREGMAPGKKLIAGRAGARTFPDKVIDKAGEIAKKALGDAAFQTKLLSPTQLEKELGGPVFELLLGELVYQSPGKPVIVDVRHPKPALPTVKDGFTDISEENGE